VVVDVNLDLDPLAKADGDTGNPHAEGNTAAHLSDKDVQNLGCRCISALTPPCPEGRIPPFRTCGESEPEIDLNAGVECPTGTTWVGG